MTMADAAQLSQLLNARNNVSGNFFQQAEQLGQLNSAFNAPPPKSNVPTLGDVIHGAIGAGLGLGVARGVTNILGIDGKFKDRLEDLGMLVGGARNIGYMKTSEERRHAFRLGFLKAAYDKGLLKEAAIAPVNIPLTPDLITAPFRFGTNLAKTTGGLAGTAAGIAASPSSEDEAIAKVQVETELLKRRLAQLEGERKNRLVKALLAQRQG